MIWKNTEEIIGSFSEAALINVSLVLLEFSQSILFFFRPSSLEFIRVYN